MNEMTLKELRARAAQMENPEHRAIMEEALTTLEADEKAQEKKKRGRGRPRLQPGEHRVPKTYTFAPDVAEYLESLPNASAYLETFVREDMKHNKAALTASQYETAKNLWDEAREQGILDAYGSESDDINEMEGVGKLVWRARSSDEVAVYYDGRAYTAIGDVHGPCGCEVEL